VPDERPDAADPWEQGPVPPEQAIRGLHSVGLWVGGYERTAAVMETLGFAAAGDEGNRLRFRAPGGLAGVADVLCMPERARGQTSVGTVHHVAWGTTVEEHPKWLERLAESGVRSTPIIDRFYFHSIYFREPSGVLFEIADDGPGFTVDGPVEGLGSKIILPPFLEDRREEIEARLTPLPDPRGEAVS